MYIPVCLCLTGSIHRHYESRRRLFNDSQPNRQGKALQTKLNSRRNASQKKVCNSHFSVKVWNLFSFVEMYEKRKKFLKGEEEISKWASIGPCYMTEESEADEEEIRQHTPQWRSEGMHLYSNLCVVINA